MKLASVKILNKEKLQASYNYIMIIPINALLASFKAFILLFYTLPKYRKIFNWVPDLKNYVEQTPYKDIL